MNQVFNRWVTGPLRCLRPIWWFHHATFLAASTENVTETVKDASRSTSNHCQSSNNHWSLVKLFSAVLLQDSVWCKISESVIVNMCLFISSLFLKTWKSLKAFNHFCQSCIFIPPRVAKKWKWQLKGGEAIRKNLSIWAKRFWHPHEVVFHTYPGRGMLQQTMTSRVMWPVHCPVGMACRTMNNFYDSSNQNITNSKQT